MIVKRYINGKMASGNIFSKTVITDKDIVNAVAQIKRRINGDSDAGHSATSSTTKVS